MDSRNDEQTELLRNIWNQMKELDRSLGQRIDKTNEALAGVKDELGREIGGLRQEIAGVRDELGREAGGLRQEMDGVKLEVRALRTATDHGFGILARADAKRDVSLDELRQQRMDRVEAHVGLAPR